MKNNKIQLPKFLKNRYNVWKTTSYLQNEKNIKKLAKLGQKPKAMIISCCDSRVNVNSLFKANIGDYFIHRNILFCFMKVDLFIETDQIFGLKRIIYTHTRDCT